MLVVERDYRHTYWLHEPPRKPTGFSRGMNGIGAPTRRDKRRAPGKMRAGAPDVPGRPHPRMFRDSWRG